MRIASLASAANSPYSAAAHGPDCACPACQSLRSDAATPAPGAADGTGDRVTLSAEGKAALSEAQQKEVAALKARDDDVRRHEAAHQAAGGALAGAASFSYEQGPDGKSYAVGGEVPIRISQGGSPQETIRNAQTVRAAALAPDDPSGQDRAVAAEASQIEQQARQQLSQQQSGNQNLTPLQKSQQAQAPAEGKTGPGQSVDTYA